MAEISPNEIQSHTCKEISSNRGNCGIENFPLFFRQFEIQIVESKQKSFVQEF